MRDQKQPFPASLTPRYEAVKLIKSGNQGHVFEADDTVMKRRVAIKVLENQACEKELLRFQVEARTVSKLNHRNILAVHDFILDSSSRACLIMEFVDGTDLSNYIKEREELNLPQTLLILQEIVTGMEHAHSHGIIHRDLKPANILLQNGASYHDFVKIADFGLARPMDDQFETNTAGRLLGTPAYMSPEQAKGKLLDERSDIYSFGCMAYELLTSNKPFEADSSPEVVLKQINEPPPELPHICLNETAQFKLQNLIAGCLEKNPDDRFANFTVIKEQLQQIYDALLEHKIESAGASYEPVEATQDSSEPALSASTSRFVKIALLAVMVLVPIVAIATVMNATQSVNVTQVPLEPLSASDRPLVETSENPSEKQNPADSSTAQSTAGKSGFTDTIANGVEIMDVWVTTENNTSSGKKINLPGLDLSRYNWQTSIFPREDQLLTRLERDRIKYLRLRGELSESLVKRMNQEKLEGLIYFPDLSQTEENSRRIFRGFSLNRTPPFSNLIREIKSLKVLLLYDEFIEPMRVKPLIDNLKDLEVLFIKSRYLQNDTVLEICKLPKLHSLYLTPQIGILDEGLDKLSHHAVPIKRLLLAEPMLSSACIKRFVDRQQELEFLALPASDVSAEEIKSIARSKIKRLGLNRTAVTFSMLKPLRANKNLEMLNIIGCQKITKAEVENLRSLMPACKIFGPEDISVARAK